MWYLQHFCDAPILAMLRLYGIYSTSRQLRSWGGPHVLWRHCCVVFTQLLQCSNPGDVANVWYVQHFAAAEIVGGTPHFLATLLCGTYSTSAMLPSLRCRECMVCTALRCCWDRGVQQMPCGCLLFKSPDQKTMKKLN